MIVGTEIVGTEIVGTVMGATVIGGTEIVGTVVSGSVIAGPPAGRVVPSPVVRTDRSVVAAAVGAPEVGGGSSGAAVDPVTG